MSKLHTEKSGTGPTIVLLHGFLADGTYWHTLAKELSQSYTVIAVDLLGFGKSPKPWRSRYDVAAHLGSIHETIQTEIAPGQPFILMGHSMGSVLASLYAAEYPEQLTHVVAINPPMFADKKQARNAIKRTNIFYRLLLYSPFGRLGRWVTAYAARAAARSQFHKLEALQYVAQGFKNTTHRSRQKSLKNVIESHAFLDAIHAVDVPLTVLVGKQDRKVYLDNLDAATLPQHAQLHILDGGHHLPIKNVEQVHQLIQDSIAVVE